MQPIWDSDRTQHIHTLLHDPCLPPNNEHRWIQMHEGSEGVLDKFELFLSDKGT